GPLSRFWLGSVADYVLRQVSVPILLLRPRSGAELPPRTIPLTRVLVPLDLSDESATILEPVKALATLTQAHLTLLYVAEPFLRVSEPALPYPLPADPELLEARKADAQRYLDQQADRL